MPITPAANLSLLWSELPYLDRFYAPADARAATPEVSNASTEMTLTAALDGRRDRQGVIGVFGDHCREQLVESGFTVVELRRGSAVSMVAWNTLK